MLQDIMAIEKVKIEPGGIRRGVCRYGSLEQEFAKGFVDIESSIESIKGIGSRDVFPLWGKKPWFARVLSMGHGARTGGSMFSILTTEFPTLLLKYVPSSGPGGDQVQKWDWSPASAAQAKTGMSATAAKIETSFICLDLMI